MSTTAETNPNVWAPEALETLPVLSLNSTLLEILDPGFHRSWSLEDGVVAVEWMNPAEIRLSWPGAEGDKANSMISISIRARPAGGARIGVWTSEPIEPDTPPAP